ncbi:MAG: hypothetical protein LUD71_00575, partial [Clostridiales bacterium]|nr:hypothetical protein [Clostridiales bacterium]
MRKFDLKQFAICVLAVISPRLVLAGAYPLVPVVFMSGFLSGVSQSLLFWCSIGWLLARAPFRV